MRSGLASSKTALVIFEGSFPRLRGEGAVYVRRLIRMAVLIEHDGQQSASQV